MRNIKRFLVNILIYILRKLAVSVIINMKVDGTLQSQTQDSYYYDCTLNCTTLSSNGQEFDIPNKQPFNISMPVKKEIHIYTRHNGKYYICYGTVTGYDYAYSADELENVQNDMKELLSRKNVENISVVWHEVEFIDSKTNKENFLKLVSK